MAKLSEVWSSIQGEFEAKEKECEELVIRGWLDRAPHIIKYHRKSGANAYLSENFPCSIEYEGTTFPSLQHAFQAMKIDPTIENYCEEVEKIRKGTLKEARKRGQSLRMRSEYIGNVVGRLELMFSLSKAKFSQNKTLCLWLLHHTGNKPIWHIFDEDTEKIWSKSFQRRESCGEWWDTDNWDGKILCAVRHVLRQAMPLDSNVLKLAVDEEFQKHCPVPEDFSTQPMENMQLDTEPLDLGTVIAGKFQVLWVKSSTGTGGYIGGKCYICEDMSPRETKEIETIRECLVTTSLQVLRNEISIKIENLCTSKSQPCWDSMKNTLRELQKKRFFDSEPPSWWKTLNTTVHTASKLPPLRAAHTLRQLLHNPPLVSEAGRPHVFIKTFNEARRLRDPHGYGRDVILEIRRCSAKTPDFSWTSLEAHVNVSAIYGGSHAGSLSHSEKKIAFVALEHCDGIDLFDLGMQMSKSQQIPSHHCEIIRGLVSQLLDVLTHLHEHGIFHCDIKPENLILTRSGTLKLVDFGGMVLLREHQASFLHPAYCSPDFDDEISHRKSLGDRLKANDFWMMNNVLYYLFLRPLKLMPRKYPKKWGESEEDSLSQELNQLEILEEPEYCRLREVLTMLYTRDFHTRISEDTLLRTKAWVAHAPDSAGLLLLVANCFKSLSSDSARPPDKHVVEAPPFLQSEYDSFWSPDIDIVEQAHSDHSVCFIVCRVGPSVNSKLLEGDIICMGDKGASSLLGSFCTEANFEVLRDGVPEPVSVLRLRDVRQCTSIKIPERFRGFLLKEEKETHFSTGSKWDKLPKDQSKLLPALAVEFALWQAHNDSPSTWTFAEVLLDWLRRGLVLKGGDTQMYTFPPDKWENQ